MRFSAAIHQIVARQSAPAQPLIAPVEARPALPAEDAPVRSQEPPPDLDQRVRMTGEW
jgi:hypothetical protein